MSKVDDWKKDDKLRMSAYYYSFTSTGVECIDRILSAVAIAGNRYHNTDCWNDDDYGPSAVEIIQEEADKAAEEIKKQEKGDE